MSRRFWERKYGKLIVDELEVVGGSVLVNSTQDAITAFGLPGVVALTDGVSVDLMPSMVKVGINGTTGIYDNDFPVGSNFNPFTIQKDGIYLCCATVNFFGLTGGLTDVSAAWRFTNPGIGDHSSEIFRNTGGVGIVFDLSGTYKLVAGQHVGLQVIVLDSGASCLAYDCSIVRLREL